MSGNSAVRRLQKDYAQIIKDPVPYLTATPHPSNILEWHYVVEGPPDSPYAGGYYHGVLTFPRDYPFRPPSIRMLTPNGRFQTNFRLCLSISDYHPDTWNPAWTVSTILTGLLSFMLENTATLGSLESPIEAKRVFAKKSIDFNLKSKEFCLCFPDLAKKLRERPAEEQPTLAADGANPAQAARVPEPPPVVRPAVQPGQRQPQGNTAGLLFAVITGAAAVAVIMYLALHSATEHDFS